MEAYTFHEGSLPAGVALDYEPAIFNQTAFTACQEPLRLVSFYVVNQKRSKGVAGIHFHIADHLARSPFKAPFGSIEFANLHPRTLYSFLQFIELQLRDREITDIFITNPPRAYAPVRLALLETFLLNSKYTVAAAEVASVLPVNAMPFSQRIRDSEYARMRQGHKAGFAFRQCGTDQVADVYNFISRCHQAKGYRMPITADELHRTVQAFPDRYPIFAMLNEEKIVAASVCVRVTSDILYNFLVNHESDYDQLSPVVPLMEGIYGFCRSHGIRLMDLGTSALNGHPNFPLLDFKIHIGGAPTSKLSFYKKLS